MRDVGAETRVLHLWEARRMARGVQCLWKGGGEMWRSARGTLHVGDAEGVLPPDRDAADDLLGDDERLLEEPPPNLLTDRHGSIAAST